MNKDYSLLRPFDLEAAQQGAPVCWHTNTDHPSKYVAGPPDAQAIIDGLQTMNAELAAKLAAETTTAKNAVYRVNELRAEVERLRAELDNIKQVEFPNRVNKVADGWREKCARLESELDAAQKDAARARKQALCDAADDFESGASAADIRANADALQAKKVRL